MSKGDATYNAVNTTLSTRFLDGSLMMSADMNGDGKTDLVVTAGGALYGFLSNGDGTYRQTSQSAPGFVFAFPMIGLGADFNGDGKGDFLIAGNNTLYTFFANGGPGNLITNITNGLGATTSVTYQPLTNGGVYSKDTTSLYPTLDVTGPLYVVQRVDASNGIGGTYSTTYTYYGAKSDLSGRGFLGFRQMNALDQQTGIVTGTGFNQNFPFIGTVAWEWKGLWPQTLNSTANMYQFVNAAGSSSVSSPSISTATTATAPYRVALLSSQAASYDLDGTSVPTVTTTYGPFSGTNPGYDAYNNPLSITVTTSDGYSKTTKNAYVNDSTNWFLGRLTQSQVTSTAPSN